METLSNTNGEKLPLLGKILKYAVPAGLIFGGLKLWNWLSPTILKAAENFWYFILMVVPAVALSMVVAFNRKVIWLWWLGFCKSITKIFVAMDPLSIMDGYLTTLRKKYRNLQDTYKFLMGKKVELTRVIEQKQEDFANYQKLALAAQKQGEISSAQLNATKALSCQNTIKLYTPYLEKYEKNTSFIEQLLENWKTSIDTLDWTITEKREEFTMLKSIVKGLKSTEDLISSDSPEAQLYGQSIKALEADVSQKIAYIDDFEKRAKPLMTNMKVQKQADQDDAIKLLEEMTKNANLQLPSYKEFTSGVQAFQNKELVRTSGKYGF